MNSRWLIAALAVAGYVISGLLWYFSANHIDDGRGGIRVIANIACLVAAALLFVAVSARLSRSGVLAGAAWSGGSVAGGALGLALFDGWRTEWGRLCNQCDPASAIAGGPVIFGALGFGAALRVGWLMRRWRAPHI